MGYGKPGEALGEVVIAEWHGADIGNSVANTTLQGIIVIPFDCEITKVWVSGIAIGGTNDPTLDVFDEELGTPASIFSSAITVDAAKDAYSGVPASTKGIRSEGDCLSVRAVTHATGGDLDKPTVKIVGKRRDVS